MTTTVKVTFGNDRKRAYVDITLQMEGKSYSSPPSYPYVSASYEFSIFNKAPRNYYYTAPTGWHIKKFTGQSYTTRYSFLNVTNEEDIRQVFFGQLRVKAKGSTIGSDAGIELSFGNDVPGILIG